eukprot:351020-Chlamydomonas_euryale.AAC.2
MRAPPSCPAHTHPSPVHVVRCSLGDVRREELSAVSSQLLKRAGGRRAVRPTAVDCPLGVDQVEEFLQEVLAGGGAGTAL